jgi:hypothetical protein
MKLNNMTICIISSIVITGGSLVHLIKLINSRPFVTAKNWGLDITKAQLKVSGLFSEVKDCELNNLKICIFSSNVFTEASLVNLINLINSRPERTVFTNYRDFM